MEHLLQIPFLQRDFSCKIVSVEPFFVLQFKLVLRAWMQVVLKIMKRRIKEYYSGNEEGGWPDQADPTDICSHFWLFSTVHFQMSSLHFILSTFFHCVFSNVLTFFHCAFSNVQFTLLTLNGADWPESDQCISSWQLAFQRKCEFAFDHHQESQF